MRLQPDRLRWYMQAANKARDTADEIAARLDCDDPLHPWGPQVFSSYADFVNRVARRIVEDHDDEGATQEAMKLYRRECPFFICASMVMMANRIQRLEAERDAAVEMGVRSNRLIRGTHPPRVDLTDEEEI